MRLSERVESAAVVVLEAHADVASVLAEEAIEDRLATYGQIVFDVLMDKNRVCSKEDSVASQRLSSLQADPIVSGILTSPRKTRTIRYGERSGDFLDRIAERTAPLNA